MNNHVHRALLRKKERTKEVVKKQSTCTCLLLLLQTCKDMFDRMDGNDDGNLTYSVEVGHVSRDCHETVM